MRLTFLFFLTALFACGNGGDGGDAGPDATGGPDVTPDVVVDLQNCVSPGTPNDDRGVGGYCSPGGGQCASSGPAGAPRICTADLSGAVAHDWYCTYPCSQPADCGSGALCLATAQGMMCVPPSCAPVNDGGSDASSDASSDAASDAASDALGE